MNDFFKIICKGTIFFVILQKFLKKNVRIS